MDRSLNVAMPVASVVCVSVPDSVPPLLGLEPMLIVIAMNGSTAPELSVAFTCTGGEMNWPATVFVGCVTKVRALTVAKPHILTKPELFDPALKDHVAVPESITVIVPAGTITLGVATQASLGPLCPATPVAVNGPKVFPPTSRLIVPAAPPNPPLK